MNVPKSRITFKAIGRLRDLKAINQRTLKLVEILQFYFVWHLSFDEYLPPPQRALNTIYVRILFTLGKICSNIYFLLSFQISSRQIVRFILLGLTISLALTELFTKTMFLYRRFYLRKIQPPKIINITYTGWPR